MLAPMMLSPQGARVLASLAEKQLTTPKQYPLTLAALVAACNQTSNRDPVVDYDEEFILATLDELKLQGLVRFALPSHGRSAVRYRQIIDETVAIDHRQCALLAVLLLRGPQTIGELRIRTERMAEFLGLEDIAHELEHMASRTEPLVSCLGRRPGQKEERWACVLVATVSGDRGVPGSGGRIERSGTDEMQVDRALDDPEDLRAEIGVLRSEVSELRRELEALREGLGG
jgi:hypothetical protein